VRQLQQLYLLIKKDVFTAKGLVELGNTGKLEHFLKLWLGRDCHLRMNSRSHPKYIKL
jgi:hypothetical protein